MSRSTVLICFVCGFAAGMVAYLVLTTIARI